MGDNFMTASTKIEHLVEKKEQINDKVAGLIAEAVKDRVQNAQLKNSIVTDILSLIRNFSDEDKSKILAKALFYVVSGTNIETSKPYIDPKTGKEWVPTKNPKKNKSSDFGSWDF